MNQKLLATPVFFLTKNIHDWLIKFMSFNEQSVTDIHKEAYLISLGFMSIESKQITQLINTDLTHWVEIVY